MNEEQQVVNTEESSISEEETQEVVNVEVPEPDQQEQPIEDEPSPVPAGNQDVDEFGVPWKNRAMENQRKLAELTERLPDMIQDKLSTVLQSQQPQQQQYSLDQLIEYVEMSDDPQGKAWARKEIARLQHEEIGKTVKDVLAQERKAAVEKETRNRSWAYVTKEHADMFANGQIDASNPKARIFGQLMQDPRFKNDPEGMMAASDLAAYYVSKQQVPKTKKQQEAMKAEIKDLQKKTMVEGSGRGASPQPTARDTALEELRQTGTIESAKKALDAIFGA